LPLQPLHGQPGRLTTSPVGNVAHDVRVLHPREDATLPTKARDAGMLRHAQDLEGDPLARDELACPVDVRHAARSDQRLQLEPRIERLPGDRKSTRLNSSHQIISYAVFCLKKKIRT